MSDFFLLRSRKSLVREIVAAWLSLTIGVLLFAFFTARFTPTMGQNGAFASALMISVPLSAMILQAVRSGQLVFPRLPKRPVGSISSKQKKEEAAQQIARFWTSLERDELEGLGYLSGMLGLNLFPRIGLRLSQTERERLMQLERELFEKIRENRMSHGPDEFIVAIGPQNRRIRVKINESKHKITANFVKDS